MQSYLIPTRWSILCFWYLLAVPETDCNYFLVLAISLLLSIFAMLIGLLNY